MKAWLTYAGVTLAFTVLLAFVLGLALGGEAARAVWFAGAVAWGLQLVAFAALIAVRGSNEMFLAGWLVGLVARFAVVGVVAYWLQRTGALPIEPALLSLVGFLFVLLLMEPLFLRRGLQTR